MVKKNAIMRYKILDSLLSDRNRHYSTEDLLDKVNEALVLDGMEPVSRRCIEKDLNTLECAPYEAPIERVWRIATQGYRKCIRYAEDGFSIFTKKLSDEEENLLSEVLNTIGQFDGLDTFEWLDGLKKRLDIKERRRIIMFDTNPDLVNRNILGTLFTAISNKQVLNLYYHPFHSKTPRVFTVHPYLLKEYNNRWFLIGSVVERGYKIYTLPIDRIVNSVKVMHHIEYVEPSNDLESRFEDIVGVTFYEENPVEKIILWINNEGYPHIKTKPLHGSQKEVKGNECIALREKYTSLEDGHFIKLKCILNTELTKLLMSYMDQIVVLEPAELANDIRQRIKNLNEIYNEISPDGM